MTLDDGRTIIVELDWGIEVDENDDIENIVLSYKDITELVSLKHDKAQRERDVRRDVKRVQLHAARSGDRHRSRVRDVTQPRRLNC